MTSIPIDKSKSKQKAEVLLSVVSLKLDLCDKNNLQIN